MSHNLTIITTECDRIQYQSRPLPLLLSDIVSIIPQELGSKLDDIQGAELYNHTEPTVLFNNVNTNMANDPDKQDLVRDLRKTLQAGWRAAPPLSP